MLSQILESVGLTPEQSDIYLSLLTHGTQSAGQLAKTTKVQRTYIYKVCQELITRGLIAQTKKDRGTTFSPLSPDHLLTYSEEQKTRSLQAQSALEGILPTLKDKYGSVEERPVVTLFEGLEGIKKAHRLILEEKKEILAYVVINKDIDQKLSEFWKEYYAIRLRDQIFVRVITPDTKDGIEYKNRGQYELRETRLVPADTYHFYIEKDIVGNKVAFFSMQEGKLIATIIENKSIADTERNIFELAWKQAGTFEKKHQE